MLNLKSRHKIPRNVVHEAFGAESVVLDFRTGRYYSFSQTVTEVWEHIQSDQSNGHIIAFWKDRYDADQDALQSALSRILQDLEEQGLIVPSPDEAGTDSEANGRSSAADAAPGKRAPFPEPSIESFDDIQNLLELDPVHDVEEEGWPKGKAAWTKNKDGVAHEN